MQVRRATLEDAAAIAAVHVRSWEAAYRGLVPDEWLAERSVRRRTIMWRGVLRDGDSARVLVTCVDGEITGFCGAVTPSRDQDAEPRTAEIAALYVDPDHWRAGAGGALVSATLDELGGASWREVTLWVFEANDRARGFYERMGFVPDGGRMAGSGEPPEVRLRRAVPSGTARSSPG